MESAKLTQHQMDTLRLCARSPVDERGFSKCAPLIYEKLVWHMPAELIDHQIIDGTHRVRLTDEARTILKYLA